MCGVGIQLSNAENGGVVELIVSKIVEGGAAEHQLAINDVIEMVDGKDVRGIPASSVAQQILGPAQTPVTLDIRRGAETKRVVILRQPYSLPSSRVKSTHKQMMLEAVRGVLSQKHMDGADTEATKPVPPKLTRAQTMLTPVLSLPQDHAQVPSQPRHNTGSFQVDRGALRSQNRDQPGPRPYSLPSSRVKSTHKQMMHMDGADTEATKPVPPKLTRAQTMLTPVLSLPQDHAQVPSQPRHNTGSFQVDRGALRSQNRDQPGPRPPASSATAKSALYNHPSLVRLHSRQIVSTGVSAMNSGLAPRGSFTAAGSFSTRALERGSTKEERPRLRAQGSVRLPSP